MRDSGLEGENSTGRTDVYRESGVFMGSAGKIMILQGVIPASSWMS